MIERNNSANLPMQLRDLLAARIDSAYYRNGQKMDSIRKLSNEFGVSAVTVSEAVKLLERDSYVVSMPGSGTYITRKNKQSLKKLDIVLAFPEESISPEILGLEIWGINIEYYLGLLDGCRLHQAKLNFEYFEDHAKGIRLQQQLKLLRKYDAAVFSGSQLLDLQKKFSEYKPVVQIHTGHDNKETDRIINANYDREGALRLLVDHARDCGYKTSGVICRSACHLRADMFRQYAVKHGLSVADEVFIELSDIIDPGKKLFELFKSPLPDMVFLDDERLAVPFYEAAIEHNVKIGKDVGVVALASGFMFSGLIPALTYVKVPSYAIARNIITYLVKTLRNDEQDFAMPIAKAQLIQGKSTVLK